MGLSGWILPFPSRTLLVTLSCPSSGCPCCPQALQQALSLLGTKWDIASHWDPPCPNAAPAISLCHKPSEPWDRCCDLGRGDDAHTLLVPQSLSSLLPTISALSWWL